MSAGVRTRMVSQVLRLLPGPVLALLDAWSYRIAQRRARERQRRWAQRQR